MKGGRDISVKPLSKSTLFLHNSHTLSDVEGVLAAYPEMCFELKQPIVHLVDPRRTHCTVASRGASSTATRTAADRRSTFSAATTFCGQC